jgi:hypothetical protein
MHIARPIGSPVMISVMGDPPNRPALSCRAPDERTFELKPAGCLECFACKEMV